MSHAWSVKQSTCGAHVQVRYPDRITLIRGNHESRQITQVLHVGGSCEEVPPSTRRIEGTYLEGPWWARPKLVPISLTHHLPGVWLL